MVVKDNISYTLDKCRKAEENSAKNIQFYKIKY